MLLDELLQRVEALPKDKQGQVVEAAKATTKNMRWVPNPGPQTDAYMSEADELFYGGSAGGGKSDLAIGLAITEHQRSLILREFLDDARGMGERMVEVLGNREGWNGQLAQYRSRDLAVDFAGCRIDNDKQRFKGKPHDLIVFDEVSDFLESVYTFIIGWNRSAVAGQRCRVVACGNPPTRPEGLWVIKRFAPWLDPKHPNPAKPGELRWFIQDEDGQEHEVDGPGPYEVGAEHVRAKSRTFIRAKLSDNPDLARTNYDATLASLPAEMRAAYRDGRFDASLRDHPAQCIPTAWVVAAKDRWTPRPPQGVPMCALGVDASGGGEDPMVIAKRYDGWYAPMVVIAGKDIPMESAGAYSAGLVIANRRDGADVVVDMGGGYGGSMYEHLRANQVECKAYKGAEGTPKRSRDGKLHFVNKRSAAYWLFREALDPGQPNGGSPIALPDDPQLIADLTAPSFKTTPQGIALEPKERVCERLGRSTDKGDAVVMAWFEGPRQTTHALDWIEGREQGRGRRVPQAVGSGRTPLSVSRTPLSARR